jgi:hypothetical protein
MPTNNDPQFKNQPVNQNLAQPTRFQMVLARSPNVTFFCQTAILPSISVGYILSPTPFVDQKVPGEKLEYSSLPVTMLVDEDLKSYREIHDWMRGYSFPTDFSEYRNLGNQLKAGRGMNTRPQYSDLTITVFNNNWQPVAKWKFIDAFPTSLGELAYSSTDGPETIMVVDITFDYQYFDILPANATVA